MNMGTVASIDNDNKDHKDKKEVNMVTVASIDELGSPSGDGAGGGEDNLVHILSVGHCCGQWSSLSTKQWESLLIKC